MTPTSKMRPQQAWGHYFDASVENNRLEMSIWSTIFILATRIYVRFTGIPSKDKRDMDIRRIYLSLQSISVDQKIR